jgi:hypothetical protein
MNYSKNEDIGSRQIVPAGTIEVQNVNDCYYEIIATNIVAIEDKEKIEPKLIEIQGLDKAGIKKRYRELRKSGQNTHEKGGGIGMYEIAKVSSSIEYEFEAINEDKYRFTMDIPEIASEEFDKENNVHKIDFITTSTSSGAIQVNVNFITKMEREISLTAANLQSVNMPTFMMSEKNEGTDGATASKDKKDDDVIDAEVD